MLIVEDGTGLEDAESYDTVAKAVAYAQAFGRTDFLDLLEPQQEIRLRMATQAIDSLYEIRGRQKVDGQALAFPRVEMTVSGVPVQGVPPTVRRAMIEMATYPGLPPLLPDLNSTNIASESKSLDGLKKSTTYSGSGKRTSRRFVVAERLMSPFIETSLSGLKTQRIVVC